jgi:hypothetical protein
MEQKLQIGPKPLKKWRDTEKYALQKKQREQKENCITPILDPLSLGIAPLWHQTG